MALSDAGMLVDLSVAIMHVTFCCSYAVRSFCSTYAGDSFCSKYVGYNFYCNCAEGVAVAIMQVVFSAEGVAVAIMQVVFSTVDYAHNCFYCNYAGDSLFIAM